MPQYVSRRCGSASASVAPGTCMRRILAGMRAMISGRQAERLGVERRVALGLAAERVQPRGEVAVRAVRLEQRDRGLHGLQQLLVGLGGGAAARGAAASRAAAAAAAGAGGAGGGPSVARRARAKSCS